MEKMYFWGIGHSWKTAETDMLSKLNKKNAILFLCFAFKLNLQWFHRCMQKKQGTEDKTKRRLASSGARSVIHHTPPLICKYYFFCCVKLYRNRFVTHLLRKAWLEKQENNEGQKQFSLRWLSNGSLCL